MTPNKFINRISLKELYEIDFIFICSLFAILVMGFVMVSSASVSVSDDLFSHPYHFMTRQPR